MTDTTVSAPNATAAASDSKPAKTVTTLEGMTGYRTFSTPDEATAYLAKCASDFSDFNDQPFALNAVNDSGEYDPEVYTEEMRVRVAVLKNVPRTVGGKKEPTTIKAIVVTPVPTIAAILGMSADDWNALPESAGKAWTVKVLDKELNHVAVRPLRDAENIATAIEQMPRTVGAFIESSRDAGGIMDTFNDLYQTINKKMGEKAPIWLKNRLIKSDLKKAMESKAYASEYFPALEDRGTDGEGKARESLFVTALRFGQILAKHKGADAAIFDKWLATRDQQTLKVSETEDDDGDLSLDDLTADLTAEDSTPATATEDAPAA
jgi:hypothetical protein